MRSFQKNAKFLRLAFFAFFCVLYKRVRHSLRSFAFFKKKNASFFAFFIKERGVL